MKANQSQGKITPAEWPIMEVLWQKNTATAAEIVAAVTAGNTKSMRTIKTLIRRLIDKNYIRFTIDEKDARVYHYTATVTKQEAVSQKNQSLLETVYQNNPGELLVQFLANNTLNAKEIEELEKLLQKKKEELENG